MSKILSLPESYMALLGKMHEVFTEPSFSLFTDIIHDVGS